MDSLTEENLNKMLSKAGEFKPDTFIVSKKALDRLKKEDRGKKEPYLCSWQKLYKPSNRKKGDVK